MQLGELLDQLIAYWRDLMLLEMCRRPGPGPERPKPAPGDTRPAGRGSCAGQHPGRPGHFGRDQGPPAAHQPSARAAGNGGRPAWPAGRSRVAEPARRRCFRSPRQTAAAPGNQASTVTPPEGVKKKDLNGVEAPAGSRQLPLTPQALPSIWEEVLRQMPPLFSAELKKGGLPAISGPNTLALRFPSRYNSARQYCQDPGRISRIEGLLSKITGQILQLRIDSASLETAGTGGDGSSEAELLPPRIQRSRAEIPADPLIQRAVEQFGAQVIHRDEGFGDCAPRCAATSRPRTPMPRSDVHVQRIGPDEQTADAAPQNSGGDEPLAGAPGRAGRRGGRRRRHGQGEGQRPAWSWSPCRSATRR